MDEADHRTQIIEVARALDAAGLVPNKSGNVSCRVDGGFAITPAGVPYRELQPEHIVTLALDVALDVALERAPGAASATPLRPSSEWRMHASVYRARADVAAVVHTHSPRATALASAGRGIPPFHYMIALAGGDIRCTPYSTFGTAELAQSAVHGLQGRRACLLGNHGVMAVGTSLARAHAVAIEVENLAGRLPGTCWRRVSSRGCSTTPRSATWSTRFPTTAGSTEASAAAAGGCRSTGRRSTRRRTAGTGPAERQAEREAQRDHHRHREVHGDEPGGGELAYPGAPVAAGDVDRERRGEHQQVGGGRGHPPASGRPQAAVPHSVPLALPRRCPAT